MSPGIARVVIDSPLPQLDRLFDYEVPDALSGVVAPGVRVRVPVRAARRVMDGWIVEVADSSEFEGRLAQLDAVVSPVPVLTPEVWLLARRVADRAVGVAADILRLAIPKRQARVEQTWLQQAPAPTRHDDDGEAPAFASPGHLDPAVTGYSDRLSAALAERARLAVQAIPEPGAWCRTLLELVQPVLASDRTAIVAAPDRHDLDRLEATLVQSIGADRVIRLDAEQSAADRYRAFLAARSRTGVVLIGTRSVVYAPANDLGLIAIWDDGDPSYQEPLAPGVQIARPGADTPLGGARTAAELGKAFPRTKVLLSHGGSRIPEVPQEPALVIATRGAEPVAVGGYRAVLLLDGERMLARESMRVVEDALRTWSNAIALAAPGAPAYLVGVGGSIATALGQWRQADVVRAELVERQTVRLPPAVRTATLTGSPSAVDTAVAAAGIRAEDVIGPVAEDDGIVRTIVRFDYRRGADVAAALRTEVVRHASGRRSASKEHPPRAIGLRVRMDDPEPFVGERPRTGRMDR